MSAEPGKIAALKDAIAKAEARPMRPAPAPVDAATVRRAVAAVIGDVCGIPPEHVREEHSLSDRLGLDLADRLQIALRIEERLALAALLQGFAIWRTVADVVAAALAAAGR